MELGCLGVLLLSETPESCGDALAVTISFLEEQSLSSSTLMGVTASSGCEPG